MTLRDHLDKIGVPKDSICFCGTCVEAMRGAIREMEKSVEHQCPSWYLQVAAAHIILSRLLTGNSTEIVASYLREFSQQLAGHPIEKEMIDAVVKVKETLYDA